MTFAAVDTEGPARRTTRPRPCRELREDVALPTNLGEDFGIERPDLRRLALPLSSPHTWSAGSREFTPDVTRTPKGR